MPALKILPASLQTLSAIAIAAMLTACAKAPEAVEYIRPVRAIADSGPRVALVHISKVRRSAPPSMQA